MPLIIRDYRPIDEYELNNVAKLAFAEFCDQFEDWPIVHEAFGRMSDLAKKGQIVVADDSNGIVGGVCYVGPNAPKFKCFELEWAVIRSLVVHPDYRDKGLGAKLTQMCIDKAIQDNCPAIALHTTPVMAQATRIYEKLGFAKVKDIGKIHGAQYFVYCKEL